MALCHACASSRTRPTLTGTTRTRCPLPFAWLRLVAERTRCLPRLDPCPVQFSLAPALELFKEGTQEEEEVWELPSQCTQVFQKLPRPKKKLLRNSFRYRMQSSALNFQHFAQMRNCFTLACSTAQLYICELAQPREVSVRSKQEDGFFGHPEFPVTLGGGKHGTDGWQHKNNCCASRAVHRTFNARSMTASIGLGPARPHVNQCAQRKLTTPWK